MSQELQTVSPEVGMKVAAHSPVSLLEVIERASRDPSVDIDKMERLMQMHERMLDRNARASFDAAFAAMQTELPHMPERGAIKNRQGQTQSTYALWEDINDIIKPILSAHGFALSFKISNRDKYSVVTGTLSHAAGHREESTFELPLDVSGSKNEVQGLGSSTSYGKRYVAGALLNLTSKGEDNDGSGARGGMSDEQMADFKAAIDALADDAAAETLWKSISEATITARDVEANNELRALMIAKRKGFKK